MGGAADGATGANGLNAKPAAWRPELSLEGPRYRALADAIAEAIARGES